MWGAALHDRAEGVHRPLLATAMVFRPADTNAGELQAIVALDHCLFGVPEIDALRTAITEKTGVPAASLVVLFSHTHAAGLMLLDRVNMPGGDLIPDYLRQLNATVADLVGRALQSVAPATMTFGSGRCDLAAHRDMWDVATQQWVCGFHPDGPADDTLLVARVANREGQIVATLVNYACHPTTLAWENRLISPDYPGALREVVEQATGAPCVFLQGASGELGPREGYVGDVAVADRNGRQVGYAALSALTALPAPKTRFEYAGPVVSGATLGAWRHVAFDDSDRRRCGIWRASREKLSIPYRPELPKAAEVEAERTRWLTEEEAARQRDDTPRVRDCRAMVERGTRMLARLKLLPPGTTYPYQLQVWRMGDAIWVAAQGELYSRLQTSLRKRFPDVPIMVCTLVNEWGPSYIPPAELYGSGLYQESVALLAQGSLEKIISEATSRIVGLLA